MGKVLRAASAAILLTAALASGCGGGGGGSNPAVVAGTWNGTLTLSFDAAPPVSGTLELQLTQDGDFAAGIAQWSGLGEPQSATATIDGTGVELRLSFFCESRNGGVVLSGSVDGDVLAFGEAEGIACFGRGADNRVTDASATLLRIPSDEPL